MNNDVIGRFKQTLGKFNEINLVLKNVSSSIKNDLLLQTNIIENKKNSRSIYEPGLVNQLLNAIILPYSSQTIIDKLSIDDISAIEQTISKVSARIDLLILQSIYEKDLLKEALIIGKKIIKVKKEVNSKKTIKNIYDTHLKQKAFDSYFIDEKKSGIEKLWEAYITKFSNIIFGSNISKIFNQFEIQRANRMYKPDFLIDDLYGGKIII